MGHFCDALRDLWKLEFWKPKIFSSENYLRVISLYFFMMKLMVLLISIHPCNISGFSTSGSKYNSHFRKSNLRKGPNLSQILLEVKETKKWYSTCLNKQKSQRWLTSILFSFRDKNPERLEFDIHKKTQIWTENYFYFIFHFEILRTNSFQNFQLHIFIILF